MVTSWITFAEGPMQPLQKGDVELEAGYRGLFVPSARFEILPVDKRISDQAASLGAMYGFKLPDAIHIATGMTAGCTHYVTGDAKWTKTGLQVITASGL
jgi:predicted nucleic acid-binding protein